MTREEELKRASLEAYPENISYSAVIGLYVDYNGEKREIWLQGAMWADSNPKSITQCVDIEDDIT